jgi:hypothetical protein
MQMNWKRLTAPTLFVALLCVASWAVAGEAAKTVTGKSSCGGCSDVVKGCCVLLTDADGNRWILRGDSDSLKAAFKARHTGKSMTATFAGKPKTKTGKDGKPYTEVKVAEVKVAS